MALFFTCTGLGPSLSTCKDVAIASVLKTIDCEAANLTLICRYFQNDGVEHFEDLNQLWTE